MLCVLELSLGENVLEVSVALVHGAALAAYIFSLVVDRLAVRETLRLVHEGLAVVAL